MKNLDFTTIRESVKNAYANGAGTFENVCKAAGLDYYKAGTNPAKKRGTPTTTVNGEVYDFHRLLKACNVDIVKHERLTAGGERIPAQRLKVDKVKAAAAAFIARLEDIVCIKFEDTTNFNKCFEVAAAAAADQDKKAAADREKAAAAAKVERKRKAAAAKVEKSSEEDKLYLAAAALGVSVEQIKAMQAQIKPAKVTK
jgi:hypothetical protein